MKNILSENMQRFGTKNLTESNLKKLSEAEITNPKTKKKIGNVSLDTRAIPAILYNVPDVADPNTDNRRVQIPPVNKVVNIPFQVYIQGVNVTSFDKFSVDTVETEAFSGQGIAPKGGTFKEVYNINQTFETGNRYHKFTISANTPPVKFVTPRYSSQPEANNDGSYNVMFGDAQDNPSFNASFIVKGTMMSDTITPEDFATRQRSRSSYTDGDEAAKKKIDAAIAAWSAKNPNGYTRKQQWSSRVESRNQYFKPFDKRSQQRG